MKPTYEVIWHSPTGKRKMGGYHSYTAAMDYYKYLEQDSQYHGKLELRDMEQFRNGKQRARTYSP